MLNFTDIVAKQTDHNTMVYTFVCMVILLVMHLTVPRVKKLDILDVSMLNSIAGGIGIGAIFVHLFPDMLSEVPNVAKVSNIGFLTESKNLMFLMFCIILGGFCAMYSIEKMAHDKKSRGLSPSRIIYFSHLGIFSLTMFAMVGTFPALMEVSKYSLFLITTLLIAEIIMEDHSFVKHFGEAYGTFGRMIVAGAIVSGWLCGNFIFGPKATMLTLLIYSLSIGIILLGVVKTEFDLLEQKSHFPTFLISVLIKLAICIALLLLENQKI